jgi:3'(2'), 5'-bisphosphate nucleotidase
MHIDIAALVAIAEAAGKAILEVYHSPEAIEVTTKSDNSPLTKADEASNALISKNLRQLYPNIPILSEEGRQAPYSERKSWSLCWQVDPLDGTKEFIKRNGEFAVNIALLQNGVAVAGVVHGPALNITAWAQTGRGAFLRQADGQVIRLASAAPKSGQPLSVITSRSHRDANTEAYLTKLPSHTTRECGASLKYIFIASGRDHLYPRFGPTMEWDTSAGQIILEEAGGELLDGQTGHTMRYNRENLLNGAFIAYGNGVREWIEGR